MAGASSWRRVATAGAALLASLGSPVNAQEPEARLEAPYFAPKLLFGAGGEQDAELEVDIVTGASFDATDDLEPTYGIAVAYVHPFLDFFALGGQVGVASWITSSPDDGPAPFYEAPEPRRSLYWDLSAVPQLNVSLLSMLEGYLSLPFGFTVDVPGDNLLGPEVDRLLGTPVDVGIGFGYHLGALLGVRIPLSDGFGLLVEAGVLFHRIQRPVDIPTGRFGNGSSEQSVPTPRTRTLDFEVSLLQSAFSAGVYF